MLDRFLDLFSSKTFVLQKLVESFKHIEKQQLHELCRELIQVTQEYANQISLFKSKEEQTRFIHQEIDRHNRQVDNEKEGLSCHAGCSFCCHWKVEATIEEAEIVLQHAADSGLNIDQTRLKKQMEAIKNQTWNQLPATQRRCVFLSDQGTCQVYSHRPSSCRKCLVVSPAANCQTPQSTRVEPLVVPETEILTSLAWSISRAPVAQLPRQIDRVQRVKN